MHQAASHDDGDALLRISGLRTHFATREGVVKAVDGVDLDVPRGRTTCLVGESGCGKSVTARSILQLVDPPGRIVSGRVDWRRGTADEWTDLATLDAHSEGIRRIRGAQIGMVFQEPVASLSPMHTIGNQLIEAIQLHRPLSKEEARDHAVTQLHRVGIPQPQLRMDAYPFELSGGMCQRAMIAIALACDPAMLIADEPTTALDVTTQARILDLLKDLQDQTGMAMLFITHDLGLVAEIADEVAVMYLGTIVEHGPVATVFDEPKHPYTQALLRSIPAIETLATRRRLSPIRGMVPHPQNRPTGCLFHPRCDHAIPGRCETTPPATAQFGGSHLARCHRYDRSGAPVSANVDLPPAPGILPTFETNHADDGQPVRADQPVLLEVRDLTMHFPVRGGFIGRTQGQLRAVDGVDLTIRTGETLGLVGESGCGKTTLGRCIARILQPTTGQLHYRTASGATVDLAQLGNRELAPYRREIRVVFQDPFSSLNPRMTLLQLVGEPLRTNRLASGSELQDRVAAILTKVGLRPEYMHRYPHAFSGGERQRVNIARALITNPRLVIADEAVSALDVSVRAQILNLLTDLQDELDLTYLFISHDLSVVEHLCDRVMVMYLGTIVETADTRNLFTNPRHPYTEALLDAVPVPDPRLRRGRSIRAVSDELPDPAHPPPGCRFHTRCPYVREDRCHTAVPVLHSSRSSHSVACHHADQLTLAGVRARVAAAE